MQEQQQLSHKQQGKSYHHHHDNDNNDQLNIIPVALPVSSNNRHNNYSIDSSLSAARSLPKSINREYSTSCASGSRTATTATGNSTMTTTATFISNSSLIDAAGIDLDSSLFSKSQYLTENSNAVLVKEDSRNNNINNSKAPTFQQQGQQQMLKKRESRSSSIISRAASRSTITVNSIYNTFARDDDDALSSLFDTPSNNRSHGRLSACSSRFSLNCTVNTCMNGKQQKQQQQQQQQDMYNTQNNNDNNNNNSNINVSEMGHDKQQPITNRDDPGGRRLSRPSSAIIHQYLRHFQDNNSNKDQQNQQQLIAAEDGQDSNNEDESSISIPAHTDNKVEDKANQAAIEYIKLTAERLWNEDEGICERERIAEWLGTKYVKLLSSPFLLFNNTFYYLFLFPCISIPVPSKD